MTAELEVGSLAHRVAERRKEREARRKDPIIIPVPGYADLFAVKYRRLTIAETMEIAERHPVLGDLAGPIASLVTACEDILEVIGHDSDNIPQYQSLGLKWSPRTLTELFEESFPPETTVRAAMQQVFDEREIAMHFKAYIDEIKTRDDEDRQALPGESGLSVES